MKYRKIPVIIEAVKFEYSKDGIKKLKSFCGSSLGPVSKYRHMGAIGEAQILTLEDGKHEFKVKHVASEGDYIIKGVKGEFYPCKPDIFLLTYELVD